MPTKISVVVPARNEAPFIVSTVERLRATLPVDAEIIVVDDGSTDDTVENLRPLIGGSIRVLRTYRLGPARARNYGAAHASGDLIIFADAHIQLPEHWWQPLAEVLDEDRVGLIGPAVAALGQPESRGYGYQLAGPQLGATWLGQSHDQPYSVPCICGCFQAMRRGLFHKIGGYDAGMCGWGAEDTELSMRLWLLGYDVLVDPRVVIEHLFRPGHPYPVDLPWLMHNDLRLVFTHLSKAHIASVVDALKSHQHFAAGMVLMVDSDVWDRRLEMEQQRTRDDNDYFDRFGMSW